MSDEPDWTERVDALTVTLVQGRDLQGVGEVLAFDWSTERSVTFEEAEDLQDWDASQFPVQVDELAGWLVVVEPNGYQATQDDVLTALSARGVAVTVFWNVNAKYQFTLARGGEVVRSFDPFLQDWEPVGAALPEEAGLPFGAEDASQSAAALELARRVTGVAVDGEWLLERPHRTWLTPGPPMP